MSALAEHRTTDYQLEHNCSIYYPSICYESVNAPATWAGASTSPTEKFPPVTGARDFLTFGVLLPRRGRNTDGKIRPVRAFMICPYFWIALERVGFAVSESHLQ